jgi:HEAT repeat protein
MGEPIDRAQIQLWVDRLLSESEADKKVEAASRLSRMAIRTRGAVRTRGGPPPARLERGQLDSALETLRNDESPAVRREVAYAIGEWGDEKAVAVLRNIATHDPDEGVRQAAISALGAIGGSAAIEALCDLSETPQSDSSRYDIVRELTELMLALKPGERQKQTGRVIDALRNVQACEEASAHVRQSAASGLAALEQR